MTHHAVSNLTLPLAALALALVVGGCSREPATETERAARGREILDRVSSTLGKADALVVDTRERRVEKGSGDTPRERTLTRTTVLQRPARLYFTASGDRRVEGWYDGVGLTLALHHEKVFAQARMPETLDRTLDAIAERYGVTMPVADFLYSSPAKVLVTPTAIGGWAGTERIDGEATDRLSFKDKGVDWDVWVARSGDQLPRRARVVFTGDQRRLQSADVTFTRWDLRPSIPADRFKPSVPGDYEGIAMLQRSAVLRNLPDEAAATSGR
jgi:hypothetical protein